MCYYVSMFGKNNTNAVVISTGTIVRAVLVLFAVYLFWSLRDLILVLLTSIVIASFVEAAIPSFKKIKIHPIKLKGMSF